MKDFPVIILRSIKSNVEMRPFIVYLKKFATDEEIFLILACFNVHNIESKYLFSLTNT